LASDYSLASATSSFDFRGHLPFLDAFVADRLGTRRRPPIEEQIHQIRRAKFQVDRMTLRRIGQLRQHVFEIVVHDQVMSHSAANHTEQPKTTGGCTGAPQEDPIVSDLG